MLLKSFILLCFIVNSCLAIKQLNSTKTPSTKSNQNDDQKLIELILPARLQEKLRQLENQDDDYDLSLFKQFPSSPLTVLGPQSNYTPCLCDEGLCQCCTGNIIQSFNTKGCMNLKYIPEEFSFEFKMKMNNVVLYKNKLSGRNPKPVCISPARIPFIDVCAKFSDIYFVGRNMHICLDVNASFEDYELFSRSFDCMRLGDQGIKIVKPEDGSGLPSNNPQNSVVDAGSDDGSDYDEILG